MALKQIQALHLLMKLSKCYTLICYIQDSFYRIFLLWKKLRLRKNFPFILLDSLAGRALQYIVGSPRRLRKWEQRVITLAAR